MADFWQPKFNTRKEARAWITKNRSSYRKGLPIAVYKVKQAKPFRIHLGRLKK